MRTTTMVLLFIILAASTISAKYGYAAQLGPTDAPVITGISPNTFASGINTPVTITGSNLVNIASVRLGETVLTDIDLLDATHLAARVPWSITPGEYDLTVTNSSEESGVLPEAVNIDPAASDWATNGPYGGALTEPSIDPQNPNRIYVGAQRSGVFYTLDGAEILDDGKGGTFPRQGAFCVRGRRNNPGDVHGRRSRHQRLAALGR